MAILTTLGILVALAAGNVAAVLSASQSSHITIPGQLAIYAGLLLADMLVLGFVITWWDDEQRGWHG